MEMESEEEIFPFVHYTDSLYSKSYSIFKKQKVHQNELFLWFKKQIEIVNVPNDKWNEMAKSFFLFY
jgi:hypothetical protein